MYVCVCWCLFGRWILGECVFICVGVYGCEWVSECVCECLFGKWVLGEWVCRCVGV